MDKESYSTLFFDRLWAYKKMKVKRRIEILEFTFEKDKKSVFCGTLCGAICSLLLFDISSIKNPSGLKLLGLGGVGFFTIILVIIQQNIYHINFRF